MPEIPEGLVAARYIGLGTGLQKGVKHLKADGTPKYTLGLEPGDEMLWRDEDVYGKTLWHDPNQNARSKYIGLGHRAMKDDEGKSRQELIEMGYEFHDPRSDLEPLMPLEEFLKRGQKKSKKKDEPKDLPQTVVLPPEEELLEGGRVDMGPDESEQEESEQV